MINAATGVVGSRCCTGRQALQAGDSSQNGHEAERNQECGYLEVGFRELDHAALRLALAKRVMPTTRARSAAMHPASKAAA